MADEKDEPKIVDVRVDDYKGVWNDFKATVTTASGECLEGYGTSVKGAISDATRKAKDT